MNNSPRGAAPLRLPVEYAGGLAIAGMAFAMLSLGLGWLPLGVAGLAMMGLASGLVGGFRYRVVLALLLWLAATCLTLISAQLGEAGFTLVGPAVLCLVFFAAGQCLGLLTGVLFRRQA